MISLCSFLCWVEVGRSRTKGTPKEYFIITEREIRSDRWLAAMAEVRSRRPGLYRTMRKARLLLEGKLPTLQFYGPVTSRLDLPFEEAAIRAYYRLGSWRGVRKYEPFWWLSATGRLPPPLVEMVKAFDQHWGRLWTGGYFSAEVLSLMIAHPDTIDRQIKAAEQWCRQPMRGEDFLWLTHMVEPLGENHLFYYRTAKGKRLRHLLTDLALKHRRPHSTALLYLLLEAETPAEDKQRIARRLSQRPTRDDLWVLSQFGPEPYKTRASNLLERQS